MTGRRSSIERLGTRMASKWRILAASAAALVVIAVAASVHLAQQPEESDQRPGPAMAVEVVTASEKQIQTSTEVAGTLGPARRANLTVQTSGEIKSVLVDMGDFVESGAVLLVLDDTDLMHQARQAEAAVEAARAQLAQMESGAGAAEMEQLEAQVETARVQAEAARKALERIEFLFQEGAVTRQALEEAEAAHQVAEQQLIMAEQQVKIAELGAGSEALKAARAQVRQAEAAHQAALSMLERSALKAPFAGIVAYVEANEGEMVSPGTPLVGVVVSDPIHLNLGVSEKVVAHLKPRDSLAVVAPAVGGEFYGMVDRVAPAADPESGLFPVRVVIDNPHGDLKAGMTAEARVVTGKALAVSVPRTAVLTRGPASHVFVVEEGMAHRREVETGLRDAEYVEILEGVSEGDVVVIRGADYLHDGSPVEIRWRE